MKTGIIFDLDGTLLDTLQDLHLATNAALSRFGYPLRTLEEIRSFVGNGALRQLTLSCPEGAQNVEEVLYWYKYYYAEHCEEHTAPYSGVQEALQKIAKRFPMAIVSNKPDAAVKRLCQTHFPGVFALGETPDIRRKPDPDMVYAAMKAIGVKRCIYVGDSEVDILTAQRGGFPCVSVLWGFRNQEMLEKAGGKIFCRTPAELSETLERMANGK